MYVDMAVLFKGSEICSPHHKEQGEDERKGELLAKHQERQENTHEGSKGVVGTCPCRAKRALCHDVEIDAESIRKKSKE